MQPDPARFFLWLTVGFALSPMLFKSTDAVAATPIAECGSSVQNVTPATLASSVGGSGCKTLVLAPGTYAKLKISNRPTGVLTLRCAMAGQCIVGNGSVVSNVNGVIIDGIRISGGSEGLRIKGSKNVLVRHSAFIEQSSAGLTVGIGAKSDNIQIHDNEFQASKRGCQYNSNNCTGRLSDGSPVAEMDYGIRLYDATSVEIKGNSFASLFNHAVSLKYSVEFAQITDNKFNACGRTCIELGQDSPTSGEATATDNIFQGARLRDVYILNIRKAVITNNTFIAAKEAFKIGTGPSGRVIIKAPNTFR